MFDSFKKLKPGIVVAMFGFFGMAFALSNESLSFIEKTIVLVVGFAVISLGVLMESKFSERFKEPLVPESDWD